MQTVHQIHVQLLAKKKIPKLEDTGLADEAVNHVEDPVWLEFIDDLTQQVLIPHELLMGSSPHSIHQRTFQKDTLYKYNL